MPNLDAFSKLPFVIKHFNGGANTDVDHEILGVNEEGMYYDAMNGRPTNNKGDKIAFAKINGEIFFHIFTDLDGYECIGTCEVNEHKIAIWADPLAIGNPAITIDDNIALQSEFFLATVSNHFQIATNSNCIGGEFFITDFNIPPLQFNVQDMLDNLLTEKYFIEFNPELYRPNVSMPNNFPVFLELNESGVGAGLPTGQYAYAIRYASDNGDSTSISPFTPLIFVPVLNELNSGIYFKGTKVFGADADVTVNTNYGIKIRFRIDNRFSFERLEIIRVRYNEGQAIDFVPSYEIVKKIALTNNQFSIYTFIDNQNNSLTSPEVLTLNESASFAQIIKRAKAVRYFNRRVVYMNIEYESIDLENILTLTKFPFPVKEAVAVIDDIGVFGYNDVWNHVYRRGYMNGEAYGFSLVVRDGFGQVAFAIPITDAKSLRFPNRRDIMTAGSASIVNSNNPVTASTVDGTINVTFDVWNLCYPNSKRRETMPYPEVNVINIMETGEDAYSPASIISNVGLGVPGEDVGFLPLSPNSPFDLNTTLGKQYMDKVYNGGWDDGETIGSWYPHLFCPDYRALGLAIHGIENIPDWVGSISIARTKKAGKVVAQGIGFYALTGYLNDDNTGKEANSLWVHIPDLDNGAINTELIDQIRNNPTAFQLQLVAPYGFATEPFYQDTTDADEGDGHFKKTDMVSYMRVMVEDDNIYSDGEFRRINYLGASSSIILAGDVATNHGISNGTNRGFVGFGRWRNGAGAPSIPGWASGAGHGNKLWNFLPSNPVETITEEENVVYYKFNFDSSNGNLYANPNPGSSHKYMSGFIMHFHEPTYIFNIVQLGREIADDEQTEYIDTGTHIKIRSVIGIGGGVAQTYYLIDERLEDFHSTVGENIDKFIYIKVNGIEYRYINLNNHPNAVSQLDDVLDDYVNETILYDGERIYGFYTSVANPVAPHKTPIDKDYTAITFGSIVHPTSGLTINSLPPFGSEIIVKYDKRFPIKVYGGDTFVGEVAFPFLHRHNGEPEEGTTNEFAIDVPFPFGAGEFYLGYALPGDGTASDPVYGLVPKWHMLPGWIRQMLVMCNVQTYSHLPLAYKESYPLVNYVMRPSDWDSSQPPHNNRVFSQYETLFPNEELRWHLGGFRISNYLINLDYSKEPNYKKYFSKPKTGFIDLNHYCNRVIWSLQRDSATAFHPGLRTFLPLNFYDISDNYGAIKYAYDLATNKRGDNLYAVTSRGIALLLTDKRILSNINADELTAIGQVGDNQFIQEHLFLEKHQGVPEELWRTIAEFDDGFIYISNESVYYFDGYSSRDIAGNYRSKLVGLIDNFGLGYEDKIVSVNDRRNLEYWINMSVIDAIEILIQDDEEIPFTLFGSTNNSFVINGNGGTLTFADSDSILQYFFLNNTGSDVELQSTVSGITIEPREVGVVTWTGSEYVFAISTTGRKVMTHKSKQLVFSRRLRYDENEIGRWIGEYDFRFDKYLSYFNKTYGFKNGSIYKIHEGYLINSSPVTFEMHEIVNIGKVEEQGKEFIRFRTNTKGSVKPTRVDFCTNNFANVVGTVDDAVMRDYIGIEQYIPRKTDAPRDRYQDTHMLIKIVHDLESEFVLRSLTTKFQNLK